MSPPDVGRQRSPNHDRRRTENPDTKAASSIDGYLNLREIAELDLDAEFVAVSACKTGLGRIYRGSGAVSLAQGFMRAGAGSVAVSLWPVYDASTSRFMQAVYRRAWSETRAGSTPLPRRSGRSLRATTASA